MDKSKIKPVYGVVQEGALHTLYRNGRVLMTPKGRPFAFPQAELAVSVMEEWEAQIEKIDPTKMPLTQLAATAIDIVSDQREKVIEDILSFTSSELLCQRAERPDSLVKKQHDVWQPVIDWCATGFGVDFTLGCGVMPVRQKEKTVQTLCDALSAFDNLVMTGLKCAVECSGSLILGLALVEGKLSSEEVLNAAELDVTQQAQSWGEDPVTVARRASMREDLLACERWFKLLRG